MLIVFAKSFRPISRAVRPNIVHSNPTKRMVVYWSIKSAIDLAGYAVGATDKFQGTGVFNSIKFERENKDENSGTGSDTTSNDSTSAKKKDVPNK